MIRVMINFDVAQEKKSIVICKADGKSLLTELIMTSNKANAQ